LDGGGVATVQLGDMEAQALRATLVRTASDPSANPLTAPNPAWA
jgi:hypothetical protein